MDTQDDTSNTSKKLNLKVALQLFANGLALLGFILAWLAYSNHLGLFVKGF